MKKQNVIISIILVFIFLICGNALALDPWIFVGSGVCPENGGNYNWDNPYNWWDTLFEEHSLPGWDGSIPEVRIDRPWFDVNCFGPNDTNCIIIDEGMDALQLGGSLLAGYLEGETCITMFGGDFNPGYLGLGGQQENPGKATFNMYGGNLDVKQGDIQGQMMLGYCQVSDPCYAGQGVFNLYDGTVNINWVLWIDSPVVAKFDPCDPNIVIGQRGELNLYGGTVVANGPLCINPCDAYLTFQPYPLPYDVNGVSGRVNIEEGVLKFAGFNPDTGPAAVDYYVRDGRITAYGGNPRAEIHCEFDPNLYKTVVWATIPDDFNTPWNASPADGDDDVFRFEILSWSAGDDANQHDLYIGTDFNDVNNATVGNPLGVYKSRQELAQTTYDPGMLDLGVTYYWRIDEVNGSGGITKGPVWSFTVTNDYVLEHFEDYYDVNEAIGIWSASGGANIDLDTSEYSVRSGIRTLLLSYDNTTSPYYSQAAVELPKPIDWTLDSCVALTVYFHGNENNAKDPFYVIVEDANGILSPKVFYSDVNDIAEESWLPWNKEFNVDLSSLTGVDITNIKKLHIGLGNASSAGGTGTLAIDDITLYPSRCVEPPAGDFDNDCDIDFDDYAVFALDYLEAGFDVISSTPPAVSLRAHYKFDGNTNDSSGNGYNGTLEGPTFGLWDNSDKKVGTGCIKFNLYGGASVQLMKIPTAVWSGVSDQVTIATWIKGDAANQPPTPGPSQAQYAFRFGVIKGPISAPDSIDTLFAQVPIYNGDVQFSAGAPGGSDNDNVTWRPDSGSAWEGMWNHYAFTKNASTGMIRIYLNGVLVNEQTDSYDLIDDVDLGLWQVIGAGSSFLDVAYPAGNPYKGRLDDFRIYNVELTQEQIASLVEAGGETVHVPAPSTDIVVNDIVDLDDLAKMTENWAQIVLFP